MGKVVLKKKIIKLKNNKENLLLKNMRMESLVLNLNNKSLELFKNIQNLPLNKFNNIIKLNKYLQNVKLLLLLNLKKQYIYFLKDLLKNIYFSNFNLWNKLFLNVLKNIMLKIKLNLNLLFLKRQALQVVDTIKIVNTIVFKKLNIKLKKNNLLNIFNFNITPIVLNNIFFLELYGVRNTNVKGFLKQIYSLIIYIFKFSVLSKKYRNINKNQLIFPVLTHNYKNKFYTLFKMICLKRIKTIYKGSYYISLNKIYLRYLIKNQNQFINKNFFIVKNKSNSLKIKRFKYSQIQTYGKYKNINKKYIFMIQKINEKIQRLNLLANTEKVIIQLHQMRNLWLNNWFNYLLTNKGKSIILSNLRELSLIREVEWKNYMEQAFYKFLNKMYMLKKIDKKIYMFFVKLKSKINNGSKYIKVSQIKNTWKFSRTVWFKRYNKKFKYWKKSLKVRSKFKGKKFILKNFKLSVTRQKEFLSFFLGRKVSLFYINALTLTKMSYYFFDVEKEKIPFEMTRKKAYKKLLQNIEKEMINRYKYIAIYIKDLVHICYVSFFLKKVTFLLNFIAFQLKKLPKNRKETQFIRFIIKVVRVFGALRPEMVGLRIKFKGRVNRWRRTKVILGERDNGLILLHTHDARIEYGSSKAIIRKGALGIRLWLAYNPIFKKNLELAFFNYINYSKYLRSVSFKRLYLNYNKNKK